MANPYFKNVGVPQEMIRRAAEALHEHRTSNDCHVLAAVALKAAIRTVADVEELLPANHKPEKP
jgi:hypothetical protein